MRILVESDSMKRTGFTLIELLTVVAVIAVLAGILFPALNAARQRTKVLVCKSNIKQLSVGLLVYEQENNTFPHGFDTSPLPGTIPHGGCPGSTQSDFQGWWWFHFLSDIIGDSTEPGSILWCPARNVEDPYLLCGNYGVNRAVCKDSSVSIGDEFNGKPSSLSQIRSPLLTLLVVDSGYSLVSWRGAIQGATQRFENAKREGAFYVPGLSINQSRDILPGFEEDAIKGRHPKKTVNIGFADSHVETIKADKLLVEEIDGKYTNRSSLWFTE